MPDAAALAQHVPLLRDLEPDALQRLAEAAQLVRLSPGAVVFRPGDACRTFLIVVSGTVRVQLVTEGGHEIVLYRLTAGDGCVLTTACLLAGVDYAAEAVVESPTEALALPRPAFEALLADSARFRHLVFAAFGDRLREMLLLVAEVAFRRLDARLAAWLLQAARDGQVRATHHAIAVELGTAREVVSRVLKELERRGLVRLGRGALTILRADELRRLAARAA